MGHLTVADLMEVYLPGPLQQAEPNIIDTASGQTVGWTRALVSLDGQPLVAGQHCYF